MRIHNQLRLAACLIVLVTACSGNTAAGPTATPAAGTLPPVVANGQLVAEGRLYPRQYADLSFNTAGTVAEVLVPEGGAVQAGQAIARLVNSPAEDSTAARAQNDSAVAAAAQAAAAAQQQLAVAQQALVAAQAEDVNARKAITDLVDSPATALNLSQAQSNIADLQRQIDDARRNLSYLVSPDLKTLREQVNQTEDALTNAQQNAALVDVSQLQVKLREAQTQLVTATNVYNGAKDAFAQCPTCLTVWAYDRTISWSDAVNLYSDAVNLVQQIQVQIDQAQRGGSLTITAAQDNLDKAQRQLNYYLQGPDAVKVIQSQANLSLLQAQLAKAQSDLEKLKAASGVDPDKLKAAEDRLAAAAAGLISARAGVATAQAAVLAAQASLAAAQLRQDTVELRAPFAGSVASQGLKVGQFIAAGQPMVTVADLSQWEIQTTDLTEIDVVKLKVGQAVTVKLDALPAARLTGVVKSIGAKYVETRGDITYVVTITLTSTDPLMRWGMTAQVTFEK
jgi:multidrug efflux pump subunit AcrA (membrane-fusion protein)